MSAIIALTEGKPREDVRPRDNWLVNYISGSEHAVLVDASKTIHIIHQSLSEGIHHWENMSDLGNRDFNRKLARGKYEDGYIWKATCITRRLKNWRLHDDFEVTCSNKRA